ncbi:MAG: type III pantothenate kinase [Fuerstiella sp.]
MTLILAVDVGNTRAKFGVFERGGAAVPQAREIAATPLRGEANISDVISEWLDKHDFEELESCIVSGSNPPARDELVSNWPLEDLSPVIVNDHHQVDIAIDVDSPSTVGIDRLLTAFAVRKMFGENQPIVVIDSGTATTVNLVTSDGTFRGGAILPGLRLSAYALHDYTARLPLIDADQLSDGLDNIDAPLPGRNTIDAMKAGLYWGQLGSIKEIAARLARSAAVDFNDAESALYVLTGGGGRQLVAQLPNAVFIDSLALHGLAMLAVPVAD